MSGESPPINPSATSGARAGLAGRAEYQPVRPACPHPDLSQKDLEFLRDHPEVWVHTDFYTLERQQRIIEGWRQILAIQDGAEVCPATGGVCGQAGHGLHGIHSGCVALSYA